MLAYYASGDLVLDRTNSRIVTMGSYIPITSNKIGRFSIGYGNDNLFKSSDIAVYENTAGKSGVFQWLGWITGAFTNQVIKVSVWLKFIDHVPKKSSNFGIKIYNQLFNEFVDTCRPNVWCKASAVAKYPPFGDQGAIIVIFDSINHTQKVLITQLKLEVTD